MLNPKDIRQGKTVWIVRLDTDSIKYRNECIWVIIPYLVMSNNYIRNPSYTVDRRMNINTAKALIENYDPLRYGVFTSLRKAKSFQKKVTDYWVGQVYADGE